MASNTNKQKAVNAIWEYPARAFGVDFNQRGNHWENLKGGEYDERGKIRLFLTPNGENITVFYNGGSRPEKSDVFTYLGDYVFHTTFKDTLQRIADLYNLTLEYTAEERQKMNRQALAREVVPLLIDELKNNPTGEAATYLTEVRGLQADGVHFGELSEHSITRISEHLKGKGYKYDYNDIKALGLTKKRAESGHTLVIPYYRNGVVTGFVLRNTRKDYTGKDKYLYSDNLGRGGYCDRLTSGEPVVIVEGQLDAVRLIQGNIQNVIATGGQKISEDIAKMLKARNITQVIYVPDLEYNVQQERETTIITEAIKAFQSAQVDGEPVVTHINVVDIPTPADMFTNERYKVYKDGVFKKFKIDIDTYGKNGGDLLDVINKGVPWWVWELTDLITTAQKQEQDTGKETPFNWFQNHFDAFYKRVKSPYEREQIKQNLTKWEKEGYTVFRDYGISIQALEDVDEWERNKRYLDNVKAATAELQTAVDNGGNPVKVAEAVRKLSEAQGENTRTEWDKQLTETFNDELNAIRNQPDTLKTKWELGNITKAGNYVKYANIEFWPADITVFCAATSHGKTAILFQSVFDLLARYPNKTFLYISCEENKRQLLERALNVYMDIPTTDTGKIDNGGYCFKSQTRKKTIKAVIRGDVPPLEYSAFMGQSDHYNDLTKQINHWLKLYETNIRPRLKLIHTDGSAESITANVLHYIREFEQNGVEVGGVFVDYMQLLTSDNKTYSRHDELKDVCKSLKRCAAQTELPIIIAAQLNRETIRTGIDDITVANIGEGADIERIAHDIYMIWQTDKTKTDLYFTTTTDNKTGQTTTKWNNAAKNRANRIFGRNKLEPNNRPLKSGYLYVEQMKARDGKTDGWGLFPFDGERGHVGENDKDAMKD